MGMNELKTAAPLHDKLPHISINSWHHKHILDLDDFSRDEMNLVFEITDSMTQVLSREVKKLPTLRGKTIATMFFEPSTRTRASFELAAKYLGADTISLDAARSSLVKGESLIDSLRTLQALEVDAIIMRHQCSGAAYVAAQNLEIGVLNAGDGWHAHPSQALLDLYTMRNKLRDLNGKKLVIVGDIMHSRVARSNIWGSRHFGMQVVLCAPPTLTPHGLEEMLTRNHLDYISIEHNLDRAIEKADIVMPLRLQKERQQSGQVSSIREYAQQYQINKRRLEKASPAVLVMHPGPINEGIEISHEVAYGTNSIIEQQVTNGVAIRMALLYLMAGGKNQ